MSKNLALVAMGIQNPEQIARFAVYVADNTDILRIIYDRKKGSILPVSKKFKFPQLKKTAVVDSGTRQTTVLYQSSNEFRNAVSELEQLMHVRNDSHNLAQLIAEEIRTLEADLAARIDYIKSLVNKI